MWLEKEELINSLKKRGFSMCNIKGGVTTLERAPQRNLYAMYMRNTGKKGGTYGSLPAAGMDRRKEVQLTFNI